MSSEFFAQYRRNFSEYVRKASEGLSRIENSADLSYEEKKQLLNNVNKKIREASTCQISMQTSGASDSSSLEQLKNAKITLRNIKKKKKRVEDAINRAMLHDPKVSEAEKEKFGNKTAESGVSMLGEGLSILDNALDDADETERELLAQGETILGGRQKVAETVDGVSIGSRLVSQMKNRDRKVRCYIIMMWLLMIACILLTIIIKYSSSDDKKSTPAPTPAPAPKQQNIPG